MVKILSLIFTIFVMTSSMGSSVTAAPLHSQDLIIVKYGLTEEATSFKPSQTTNDGLFINNLPVDNLGNSLSPMSGIHYLVQEVLPTDQQNISLDDPKSYQKVGSSHELVTGPNGQAILQLTNGYYIVSEQANAAENLLNPAVPFLIRLPVESNAGYLSQVYIYPKSSVDPEATNPLPPASPTKPPPSSTSNANSNPPPSSSSNPPSPSANENLAEKNSSPALIGFLPDTGEARSALAAIGLGLLLVLFFIWVISRRKQKEEDEDSAS